MINYEMALYEIEMYKKAHESLSENLTQANKKVQQFKEERDTLIDDLSWYKVKVSRLEREKERLKEIKQEKEQLEEYFQYQLEKRLEYFNKCQELKKENKALRLQSDAYFEQWQQHKALNNEFSQHIGNKPSSSTYKYFRAKLDGIGIKEGE